MDNLDLENFIQKIKEAQKKKEFDLSVDEDLSLAIMNLASIEEHFFFTGAKTGKKEYFDLLNEAREIRKKLLKKIIKDYEGEVWCLAKHLLAASMRLYEVGAKKLSEGDKKEAYDFFEKSYHLYSLFWGITLGAVKTEDIKKIDNGALNKEDQEKNTLWGKLGQLVQKVIDCCRE